MERQSSLRKQAKFSHRIQSTIVARQFSELQCLMNTLDYGKYTLNFDKHLQL